LGSDRLRLTSAESAGLDAQLLAALVLGTNRTHVLTHPELELTQDQERQFFSLIERRALHEPVAYISGICEFMSLSFYVNRHVLLPRPDTETLVEAAIREVGRHGAQRVLEVGTGSGCIAVSLAAYCPDISVTAVDISADALSVASFNAEAHKVDSRVTFVNGDIFNDSLTTSLGTVGRFDILLSNPPYITSAEMAELPPSVASFEPHAALAGGADGLNFYREIARRASGLLRDRAGILLEIGCTQADDVQDILGSHSFANISVHQDLSGKDRVIRAEYSIQRSCKLVSPP